MVLFYEFVQLLFGSSTILESTATTVWKLIYTFCAEVPYLGYFELTTWYLPLMQQMKNDYAGSD